MPLALPSRAARSRGSSVQQAFHRSQVSGSLAKRSRASGGIRELRAAQRRPAECGPRRACKSSAVTRGLRASRTAPYPRDLRPTANKAAAHDQMMAGVDCGRRSPPTRNDVPIEGGADADDLEPGGHVRRPQSVRDARPAPGAPRQRSGWVLAACAIISWTAPAYDDVHHSGHNDGDQRPQHDLQSLVRLASTRGATPAMITATDRGGEEEATGLAQELSCLVLDLLLLKRGNPLQHVQGL